jgi:hypothetical protein
LPGLERHIARRGAESLEKIGVLTPQLGNIRVRVGTRPRKARQTSKQAALPGRHFTALEIPAEDSADGVSLSPEAICAKICAQTRRPDDFRHPAFRKPA